MLLVFSVLSAGAADSKWKAAAALERKPGKDYIKVKSTMSTPDRSVFVYSVPDIQINQADSISETVSLGNAVTRTIEGEPVLPVIPVKFVIPAGKTIEKINITGLHKVSVPGKHTIEHGKAVYPLIPGAVPREAKQNASIYNSDDAFPKKTSELVTIQKKHGISIAIININPVIYHPRSGQIAYYKELQLEITTVSDKKSLDEKGFSFPKKVNADAIGIENPEVLGSYTTSSSGVSSLGLCNSSDSYRYVIVTSRAIRDATTDYTVRDLIAHRQTQGLTATITAIEDILLEYNGVDNAEKLRNFIIDAYTNWETEYVLLGGDINIIPMRKLYSVLEGGTHIPSDLYFQCLDGNYNFDNDSYWGEVTDGPNGGDVDLMAEVYIGRASAENETEMSHFVYKTLKYETDSDASSYLRTALMCGEHLGFGGVSEYAKASMEEIRLGASTNGYTTAGFTSSSSFTVNTLYDADGTWSRADIINRINSNEYSIINHLGHANANYVMKFYNADADNLRNTNPLFLYSQGCIPGNFEVDCIAEHLTTSNRSGLYGGVLNSRYGWGRYNSTDGPSQRFDRQFWDAYFGENLLTIGELNADSHEDNLWGISDNYIRWCYYETNLFGDPRTVMRGKITGPLVSYSSHTTSDYLGNNNGIAEPGEQIKIPVTLANNGSTTASSVSATLTTTDSYITVSSGVCTYGDIACCGASKTSPDSFLVSINQNCPTPRNVQFTLTITDANQHTWQSNFSMQVNSVTTISGSVKTFTGANPVVGAQVHFSGPMNGSVVTDNNGQYSFDLIGGSYHLYASSDDYLNSDTVLITTPPGRTVDFTLKRPVMAVSPTSIQETLMPGASKIVPMTISNSGDATLRFEIAVVDEAAVSIKLAEEIYDKAHFSAPQKGVDTRVGLPARTGSGGPDLFGYKWKDSREPNGPSFTWEDISTTGTRLSSVSYCDDCNQMVNLSFEFEFYGTRYSSIYVSSNGYITLGSGYSDYYNYALPSTAAPANMIAGFWDDLRTTYNGDVYFKDYGNKAIVQFTNVEPYSGSGYFTYQMVLWANGTINYYYQNMSGTVTSATVGIQNATRNDGLNIVYNSTFVENGLAVEIKSAPQWLSVSPEEGTCDAGSTSNIAVRLDATELPEGNYSGRLLVSHNDPIATSPVVIPVDLTVLTTIDPPVITVQPVHASVFEGQTAQFSITATGPNLSYQWKKDDSDISGATSATLITAPVSLTDNGAAYTCEVSNSAGSVISDAAILTVLENTPTILEHPANVAVEEGQSATFSVVASGSNLQYQWQKNETDIPGATGSEYTIASVPYADNGALYRCIVSNSGGSVTSNEGMLTVIRRSYQMHLVSIGASSASVINTTNYTAEGVVIGSSANGLVQGTRFKLYLK